MDFEKIAPLAILGFTQFLGWLGSRNKQSEADAKRDMLFNEFVEDLKKRVEILEGEVERLKNIEQERDKLLAENESLKKQLGLAQ